MKAVVSRLGLAFVLVCVASSLAFAQGATVKSTLAGTVVDKDGGAIPGASVNVKNLGTGQTQDVVTNGSGAFSVPALDSGKYDVTVTLQNFKTANVTGVVLTPGGTSNLKVVLEIGNVSDTVKVVAHTELVETASTAVTATINADQINNLPLVTKNALNFVTFLPGVNAGAGHSQRASTMLGLPQSYFHHD